jgi:Zn-dependent M28 family amino/carboxypeptidase
MQVLASQPNTRVLPETVRSRLEDISPASLRDCVAKYAVPRVYSTEANYAVRAALADELSGALRSEACVEVDEAGNVIAGDSRAPRVIIGAHFDAVPGTPGADDNASALAALIAAARAIGTSKGVCYVAFDGEEQGLIGSRCFVEQHRAWNPEQVHILEMVGYASHAPDSQQSPIPGLVTPTVGNFLALVGSHRSLAMLRHVLDTANTHPLPVHALSLPDVPLNQLAQISRHLLRSDHAPFWSADRPALMWTDTAEFRNPHYHRPSDTPDTLDYDFLAQVTRLLIHVALEPFTG